MEETITKVVVLHGLFMSSLVMHPLSISIKKQGFQVLNLTYKSLDPDENQIFNQIDQFIAGENAAFVCHSMGGLIARAYLQQLELSKQTQIKQVITLGTPHTGASIARYICQKGLQPLLKNSCDYLLPNNERWEFSAHLYSIAGNLPIGLMPLLEKDSISDGTVLMEETQILGMTEHKIFKVSHTALIYSKAVNDYILDVLTQN